MDKDHRAPEDKYEGHHHHDNFKAKNSIVCVLHPHQRPPVYQQHIHAWTDNTMGSDFQTKAPSAFVSTDELLITHSPRPRDETHSRKASSLEISICRCPSEDGTNTPVNEGGRGTPRAHEKKTSFARSYTARTNEEGPPPYTLREFQKGAESTEELAPPHREKVKTSWFSFYQVCGQWKGEVGFLVFGLLSLVAIVVGLALVDGMDQKEWTFFLTLNTVISVLGTASRASLATAVGSCLAQEKWNWFLKRQDHLLMFDRIESASRGEIGSFKLLFWLKFR